MCCSPFLGQSNEAIIINIWRWNFPIVEQQDVYMLVM